MRARQSFCLRRRQVGRSRAHAQWIEHVGPDIGREIRSRNSLDDTSKDQVVRVRVVEGDAGPRDRRDLPQFADPSRERRHGCRERAEAGRGRQPARLVE